MTTSATKPTALSSTSRRARGSEKIQRHFRPESWGRWSNAQLGNEVEIEFNDPLPQSFDLVITAKPMAQTPIALFR
jgi:hypothetical protein